jgi:predicted PurR-regulated permease PerM
VHLKNITKTQKPNPLTSSKPVKLAAILLSLALLVFFLVIAKTIISPIIIAVLFAILLKPVVNFFTKRLHMPSLLANLLAVFFLLILTLGILSFISWQIMIIVDEWAGIKLNVSRQINLLQLWIAENFDINFAEQDTYLSTATDTALKPENDFISNTLSSLTDVALNSMLIPIYTFLLLYYNKMFVKGLYKMVDTNNHSTLASILLNVKMVVQSYIVGLLIQMVIVSGLTAGGLMLLGVEYAIFLGVITALLNLIPYIGIMMATSITLMVTLITPNNLIMMLWVIILAVVVQFIDNNILVPRIVGNKVRLNALVTIVGVVVGGYIAGVTGMFLAVPVLAILKVIFDRIESLAPWGYLMGSDIDEKDNWGKFNLENLRNKKP